MPKVHREGQYQTDYWSHTVLYWERSEKTWCIEGVLVEGAEGARAHPKICEFTYKGGLVLGRALSKIRTQGAEGCWAVGQPQYFYHHSLTILVYLVFGHFSASASNIRPYEQNEKNVPSGMAIASFTLWSSVESSWTKWLAPMHLVSPVRQVFSR